VSVSLIRASEMARALMAGALALALSCLGGCEEAPPLPGYEPDPMLVAATSEPSLVREHPDRPGVRAPVDLALVLLRAGEPNDAAERLATTAWCSSARARIRWR
jgi:hypothetical protein